MGTLVHTVHVTFQQPLVCICQRVTVVGLCVCVCVCVHVLLLQLTPGLFAHLKIDATYSAGNGN